MHTGEATSAFGWGEWAGGGGGNLPESDPALAETSSKPSFGQTLGEEERKRDGIVTNGVSHCRWVDVSQSTVILLSLKLNYPCDYVLGGLGWQGRLEWKKGINSGWWKREGKQATKPQG